MKVAQQFVGTAGWSIPGAYKSRFPSEGSLLERYATRFEAVEVNSSFSRSHRRSTYEKWARSVGPDFRFSVELPKAITHDHGLADASDLVRNFADEVTGLGDKLGVVLVQLPPKLAFDAGIARRFFGHARSVLPAAFVIEPRHASWFTPEADALLKRLSVARVAAHPVLHGDGKPGGWDGFAYYRLHGAPRTYYSDYGEASLDLIAEKMAQSPAVSSWCIFDNTAAGAALGNALLIAERL